MTKAITFRTDDDTLRQLDQLASSLDRDRSYLINEAVGNYLDLHHWQINEISQAITEADSGDFASGTDVRAAFDAFKHS